MANKETEIKSEIITQEYIPPKIEIFEPGQGPSSDRISNSIQALNQPLADMLSHIGLPTENVLYPIEERKRVIFSLESTLECLPYDKREKANYLSKFTVAITVGLFDGAITFLWDETITAIRKLVQDFDLQHCFNIAGTMSPRYKNLHNVDDLPAISEHDLLEICRRIGLINDINFKRLEHVNYLRNHASSAHPNENEVTGTEILTLLEYCLRYAITAEPDHSVIQIKTLLENIRTKEIPADDCNAIGQDIAKQPQERIDDFMTSIYGLYCDPRQEQKVRDNIEHLVPHVWACCSEETKYAIGARYGVYRKNGEIDKKEATNTILELVDGSNYKDEDSLAGELIDKLQTLRTVHFEWNNFYNEYIHAQSINTSLPKTGGIPPAARKLFVKVITMCFIGNGKGNRNGVDEGAEVYYKKFISLYNTKELVDLLYLFEDNEFVTDFDANNPDKRIRGLVKALKAARTTDVHIDKALDIIISFPKNKLSKVWSDTRYQEALKYVNKN
ncbi:hypothetical protein ACQJ18_12145 [Priestia megaterium]|uniref:hypothetical protein n=1 Tax=Priestia megaterium TaxID=1404 RepID=UPI003CFEB3E5